MQEGDALPRIVKHVTQAQIERYAAASGDFNPIHVDHGFAASSQFGGTIAHGMMVAAFISEMMTATFEDAWLQSGRLKLRFRAPVYPGETVATFGQVRSIAQQNGAKQITCSVSVQKQNGDAAITGEATVTIGVQG